MSIQLKRIYEKPSDVDGLRILVDRLWPRGISKKAAMLDYWLKEIGPTTELRKGFNHDPKKFPAFKEAYIDELKSNPKQRKALQELKEICNNKDNQITLLYGAKDTIHNQAVILKELLDEAE
ncbi:DUF488 domain-containing protein [Cerasibacillus terrae]|nr:DUF488 domain-containing protein [Cerasibacillus terrae]